MNNWNLLLARQGFTSTDLGVTTRTSELLAKTIDRLLEKGMTKKSVSEDQLMNSLEEAAQSIERIGMETLVDPTQHELPLAEIDPYIRGIVRWLNELGIYTLSCCDGHNKRPATIYFLKPVTKKQMELIKACTPTEVKIRLQGKKISFFYKKGNMSQLLDIAEKLYVLTVSPEKLIEFEAEKFKVLLIKLLSISGASGNERRIRQYLQQRLKRVTDFTYVDSVGNLLATIHCGEGPTVLLSAHMDTVEEFVPGREIIEKGTILSSSKGILGADDRAGIAVILEMSSRIHQTNFNGTLKVSFTVKEEIGLIGSREIDQDFLEDVDCAIVVDRRGKRDIVTSYGDITPFCTEDYGETFKQAGALAGMDDWKVTAGGSSDARIFAEYGIPSVNLSVGYMNEHTKDEVVDYLAAYETVLVIDGFLHGQICNYINGQKKK